MPIYCRKEFRKGFSFLLSCHNKKNIMFLMWVSIDFCLVPLGEGVSLSPYVAACTSVIKKYELDYQLGPNGTAIEGDWEDVFLCVKECHQEVHSLGAKRIYTTLKINTRSDHNQSFREKVPSVLDKIGER